MNSLPSLCATTLAIDPHLPAIEFAGVWHDWGFVQSVAQRVRALLTQSGISADTAVSFVPRNRPTALAALIGMLADGRSVRMVYAFQSPTAIAAALDRLGSSVAVMAAEDFTPEVRAMMAARGMAGIALSDQGANAVAGLEAGLAVYQGRALVNSTTGEDEVLERVLPLVRKYDAAVVAISNDDSGISENPDDRFEIAKKIVQRAADHGIKACDVIVDPLVMPIGAINSAGRDVFYLLRRLREELKVNTTCGASNISFGLPNRHAINNAFLPMVAAAGMTSAIVNPLHEGLVAAIKAADVLNGVDPSCMAWIRANRDPNAEPSGEGRGGRRGGRRRG